MNNPAYAGYFKFQNRVWLSTLQKKFENTVFAFYQMGRKLIPKYKSSYPGTSLRTRVRIFVSRYKSTYPGTNLHTQKQNIAPRYKSPYPGTNHHTQVQIFTPMYKTSYPGTKLHTQVRNWFLRLAASSEMYCIPFQ
jgi:hypothetical protein